MIDGNYIERMQRYEAIVREADERRLLHAAGGRYEHSVGTLSAILAGVRTRLSRITAPALKPNNLTPRARHGTRATSE